MAINSSLYVILFAALLFAACDSAKLSTQSTTTGNPSHPLHAHLIGTNATCSIYQWFYNTSNGPVNVKKTAHCYTNRCNATLTKSTGTFTSPYYPLKYQPSYCTYTINAPAGKIISIKFPKFNVGPGPFDGLCYADTLTIYDKSVTFSANTVTLCGNNASSFISTTNKVILVLRAASMKTFNGFSATYKIASPGIIHNSQPVPTNSGQLKTEISNQNSTCKLIRWYYNTPQGKHVVQVTLKCNGVSFSLSLGAIIAIVVSAFVVLLGISITICCCCCACCASIVKKGGKKYANIS